MKIAGVEINMHRKRLMGPGSFWLETIRGDHRVDVYFEPVNGFRHFRFRRDGMWVGALLVIGQDWRRRREFQDLERAAMKADRNGVIGRIEAGFTPEAERLAEALGGFREVLSSISRGEGEPASLRRQLADAEQELEAATRSYSELTPGSPEGIL